MTVRLEKAWLPRAAVDTLPGHMGVYELGDRDGNVILVGYAGGHSRFGLRGEIEAAVAGRADAAWLRFEITTAYLTRYQELLMAHQADRGRLPAGNAGVRGLGRLSPG